VLQGEDERGARRDARDLAFVLDEIERSCCIRSCRSSPRNSGRIKGGEGPARASDAGAGRGRNATGCAIAGAEAEIGWVVDLVSDDPLGALGDERAGRRADSAGSRRNRRGVQRPRAACGRRAEAPRAPVGDLLRDESAPRGNRRRLVVRGAVAALPLAGFIDLAAEKARLAKEIGKFEGEVKKIDAKLGNADFVKRAPEEVVEENRERRAEAVARIQKMQAALAQLAAA
jgi:valyl-tRNA synthetase